MTICSRLFSPLSLGPITLPNRIMISPMCQYSAIDGNPVDWHLIHLGSLAISGAGLLCLEATAVTPEGRITPGCLGLYSDENQAGLQRVVSSLRSVSAIPLALQLSHAGRKASSRAPWDGGALILEATAGAVRHCTKSGRAGTLRDGHGGHPASGHIFRASRAACALTRLRRDRATHGARLPAASVHVAAVEPV
jgi:2,4-dienoyl-CoA reductase-like NADH-dependent reductase (Old Yellow Enzyme family)